MAEILRNKSIGKKVIIGIDGSDNAISAIECKFSFSYKLRLHDICRKKDHCKRLDNFN